MFEKTIGVISPRNELNSFTERKVETHKAQAAENKTEFQKYLKQFDTKNEKSKTLRPGENKQRPDELDAEKKLNSKTEDENKNVALDEKEGVQKRKNKAENNEMVLNSMDSTENVPKTLDSEVNLDSLENLAGLEKITNSSEIIMSESMPIEEKLKEEIFPEVFSLMSIDDQAVANQSDENQTVDVEISPFQNDILKVLNQEQILNQIIPNDKSTELVSVFENKSETSSLDQSTEVNHLALSLNDFEAGMVYDQQSANKDGESSDREDDAGEKTEKEIVTSLAGLDQARPQEFKSQLGTSQVEMAAAPKQDLNSADNMNEILQKAQYLVTQGGGEVSVKMTPEGLGEVHLKVILENGVMSLEMNTQDKTVEKLIHQGLSDLKSSLAEQQIQIEHVTLNSRLNTIASSSESQKSDFNQSSQRQHEQQSFNQHNFQQGGSGQNERSSQALRFLDEESNSLSHSQAEIKKLVGQRVYQSHKAQSINRVA